MDDEQKLADEIDKHCLALLRSNGTQAQAIAWMKTAFNLLEKCSKDLRRPRLFAVHNGFGAAVYTLEQPSKLILPKDDGRQQSPIWFAGKTVEYGDKYQNRNLPWTIKDGRKLVRQQEQLKRKK